MKTYEETELYKEILARAVAKDLIDVIFPNLKLQIGDIIETACYKALQKIKAVIGDDSLSDFDCMEQIVQVFEDLESDAKTRRDFG